VSGVGVGLAKWVGNIRIGLAEIPAERASVDLTEADDLPLRVSEFARELPERIAVVAGEDLLDLVAGGGPRRQSSRA